MHLSGDGDEEDQVITLPLVLFSYFPLSLSKRLTYFLDDFIAFCSLLLVVSVLSSSVCDGLIQILRMVTRLSTFTSSSTHETLYEVMVVYFSFFTQSSFLPCILGYVY